MFCCPPPQSSPSHFAFMMTPVSSAGRSEANWRIAYNCSSLVIEYLELVSRRVQLSERVYGETRTCRSQ